MGQKVHPIGIRLGIVKDWDSVWYAKGREYPEILDNDLKVRKCIRKALEGKNASVGKVRIERVVKKNILVVIHTARPGIIFGKKGEDIEVLKARISKVAGVPADINIEEIKKPEIDAQLVVENAAGQVEKRVMYRRVAKRAMQNAMKSGAKGFKIEVAGRLNGAEIARSEVSIEGRVPLHTLCADIDYATAEAKTTYGIIGVKVWIFKGEHRAEKQSQHEEAAKISASLDVG